MVETSTGNPYEILSKTDEYEIRLFQNENPKDLYWHRDKEDRTVHLIYGEVDFQFDNKVPFRMSRVLPVKIKAGEYHRVISNGMFILKIYKENKNVRSS